MARPADFGTMDTANLRNCLIEANLDSELKQLVLRTLHALVVTGFVSLISTESALYAAIGSGASASKLQITREQELESCMVKLLTRHNIVDANALVDLLPDMQPHGLMPATQFTRMLLVREFGK